MRVDVLLFTVPGMGFHMMNVPLLIAQQLQLSLPVTLYVPTPLLLLQLSPSLLSLLCVPCCTWHGCCC